MESITNVEEIDFQKYFQVVQRRWLPACGVFGISVALATLYAFSLKPSYQADGTLLIKTNNTSSLTGLGQDIGKIEALNQQSSPSETQTKIITSNQVIIETIKQLNLKKNQGKPLSIKEFKANLKVDTTKGTDLIQVSYQDVDPKMSALVVNTLMDIYLKRNIQDNRAEASAAGTFVDNQRPRAAKTVQAAELELRRFKEANKVINLEEEATASVNAIARLEDQIAQTQAQLADATARVKTLQEQANITSQQAVTSSSLSQVPGVQQVLTQLQEAQSQLAQEKTRFLPNHPNVINLEERVAALNALLEQRIGQVDKNQQIRAENLQLGNLRQKLMEEYTQAEVQRAGLAKQAASLSKQWLAYKQRANILPRLEQKQRELERKLKAAQSTYENLLIREQEIRVTENQNIGNARIVSYALVPDSPAGPRKFLLIAAGVVVGIISGITTAFALDLVDSSLKTIKEVRELFSYTVLGIIPLIPRNSKKNIEIQERGRDVPQIVGRDTPLYPFSDAYQMLQANLKFLGSDHELKTMVVSSSVCGEGKSEVSANLAVAMAQVGRRVLLVDADMRCPVQHHIWGLTNATGLSNVLVNQVSFNLAVEEVIPNLHILQAGVLPPNPVALLDSKRMAALVEAFAKHYDVVIFDAPPLSGIVDAAVLSKLADGILLVVRPGVVNWNQASAAKEFLIQSEQKVLGMVINGVNVKREPDSYFYYSRDLGETDNLPRNGQISSSLFDRK